MCTIMVDDRRMTVALNGKLLEKIIHLFRPTYFD